MNDKRATGITENSLKIVNGRFEAARPWNSDDLNLKNNCLLASKRLTGIQRKLLRDGEWLGKYARELKEMRYNGIVK